MQKQLRRAIQTSLVGLAMAGVAGCTGGVQGGENGGNTGTGNGQGTSGGNTGGGGTTPGSGGNSGTGSSGTGGGSVTTCVPGIPASSQFPRMKNVQYDTVVKDLFGITTLSNSNNQLPSAMLAPDSGGAMTDIAWSGYLAAADKVAAAVMASPTAKAQFISCDPTVGTCLTDTIKAVGRKMFRRPLTDAEVTSIAAVNSLTPKGTSAEIAEAALYTMLTMPSFIMLPELATDKDASGAVKLNSYEVAARLSFLLWNSVPDDTLNTAADKGQLQTTDQISAQAVRMLQSPKAAAVASTFHRNYLGIEQNSHWLNNKEKDATKYPSYTAQTYNDALAEVDAFFGDIVTSGGTFKDIFTSANAFVTKDTAKIYGLDPTKFTSTPTKTALDATKRPGFLTRAGFLSTFAHAAETSPILRGAFITQKVLGIFVGTPDPTFAAMQPPPGQYATNRARVEALTMTGQCVACHPNKVNPPGFVMEHYDATGAWQDKDPLGGDINSTADVQIASGMTKTISSAADLMAEVVKAPGAQKSYVQAWVAYATGRTANSNDACIVDKLTPNLASGGYTIAKMMADYTQADSFRLRTVGN